MIQLIYIIALESIEKYERVHYMKKFTKLTEEEFSSYKIDNRTIHLIENYLDFNNITKKGLKILDYGCGSGSGCQKLGKNAYEISRTMSFSSIHHDVGEISRYEMSEYNFVHFFTLFFF